MPRFARLASLFLVCLAMGVPIRAVTVRIENTQGDVTARVGRFPGLAFRRASPARQVREEDTRILREKDLIVIQVNPSDGARIDLEVDVPYGLNLQLRTTSGAISVEGFTHRTEIITETGDIGLRMPWSATRVKVESRKEPAEVRSPRGYKFARVRLIGGGAEPVWRLSDKLPDLKVTYGRVEARAGQPGRLVLEDMPIPDDSPVKLPWQAPPILRELLEGRRASRQSVAKPEAARPATVEDGRPLFSSNVRLVSLTAAVVDSEGHPIPNLDPEDFEVREDGVPQQVTFAGSEEVPFNLVLLLDLSGSTRQDRPAMRTAATGFVGIARQHDRVALYVLARDIFHAVSPLTADRALLTAGIEAIPDVAGTTPLYDTVLLAYAQELRQRPAERNALIVISDGVDNQIHGTGVASSVSFKKLRRAAEGIHALIYPIFLDPFTVAPPPNWSRKAKKQMGELATATGGRLFTARSVHDLDPVYPLVAEELRSVYSVAYSPKNQNFDGSWRQVQVRVKRRGAKVRTRTGYFAR